MATPLIVTVNEMDLKNNKYIKEYISSKNNQRVVSLSKLTDKKYRDSERLFICEGYKLANESLTYCSVRYLIISENTVTDDVLLEDILKKACGKSVHVLLLSEQAFLKLSTEKSPQGIISICDYFDYKPDNSHKNGITLFLDGIRDPGNLGTIIRSSESFGAREIILFDSADPYNTKTVRASMGSIFRIPFREINDPEEEINELKKRKIRVLSADISKDSLKLGSYEKRPDDCIVMGNEGHGISDNILKLSDNILTIPMTGNTESLNVAQAATCILWDYFREFHM